MIKKFNLIFEQLMSSLDNSTKKSTRNINQMDDQQFLTFLRNNLSSFINMPPIIIQQKINGKKITLTQVNNDLLIQNSSIKWLYEHLKEKFDELAKIHKTGFKVIGQLIWYNSLIKRGKITPIGASYLTNEFGTKGGIIIFDLKKIQNDQLVDFDKKQYQKLLNDILSLSDSQFKFIKDGDIILDDIEFTLDIDKLSKLLQTPQFNKSKFSKEDDEAVLNAIKDIRNQITTQNEKNNSSIEQDKYTHILEQLQSQFLKKVFGYEKFFQIKKYYDINKEEQYKQKFNQLFSMFINQYGQILNNLKNDNTISKGTKTAQYQLAKKKFEKLYPIQSFYEYLKKGNQI